MKKVVVFAVFLLFALSMPMAAMADVKGGGKGTADGSSCMKHMERGGGMKGRDFSGGHEEHERMFRLPWFYLSQADELKLTDEQKASLKKMCFAVKKDMITKGADVKVKELELKEMLSRPDYKPEDATAKLKEISDARLACETAMLQYAVQARDVLTPDQLKAVKDHCGKCCDKGGKCGEMGMMKHHMMEEEE